MFTKAKEMLNSISNAFSAVKQSAKDFGAKISTAASDFAGWCQRKIRVWKAPGVNPHMFRSGSQIAELELRKEEKGLFSRLFRKESPRIAALEQVVTNVDQYRLERSESEIALAKRFGPREIKYSEMEPVKPNKSQEPPLSKNLAGLANLFDKENIAKFKAPVKLGFKGHVGVCMGGIGKVVSKTKREQDIEKFSQAMSLRPS